MCASMYICVLHFSPSQIFTPPCSFIAFTSKIIVELEFPLAWDFFRKLPDAYPKAVLHIFNS